MSNVFTHELSSHLSLVRFRFVGLVF
eukprot:COSAG04_NODE_23727_length_333_cov_1.072650_1_plen_25_part_01